MVLSFLFYFTLANAEPSHKSEAKALKTIDVDQVARRYEDEVGKSESLIKEKSDILSRQKSLKSDLDSVLKAVTTEYNQQITVEYVQSIDQEAALLEGFSILSAREQAQALAERAKNRERMAESQGRELDEEARASYKIHHQIGHNKNSAYAYYFRWTAEAIQSQKESDVLKQKVDSVTPKYPLLSDRFILISNERGNRIRGITDAVSLDSDAIRHIDGLLQTNRFSPGGAENLLAAREIAQEYERASTELDKIERSIKRSQISLKAYQLFFRYQKYNQHIERKNIRFVRNQIVAGILKTAAAASISSQMLWKLSNGQMPEDLIPYLERQDAIYKSIGSGALECAKLLSQFF